MPTLQNMQRRNAGAAAGPRVEAPSLRPSWRALAPRKPRCVIAASGNGKQLREVGMASLLASQNYDVRQYPILGSLLLLFFANISIEASSAVLEGVG